MCPQQNLNFKPNTLQVSNVGYRTDQFTINVQVLERIDRKFTNALTVSTAHFTFLWARAEWTYSLLPTTKQSASTFFVNECGVITLLQCPTTQPAKSPTVIVYREVGIKSANGIKCQSMANSCFHCGFLLFIYGIIVCAFDQLWGKSFVQVFLNLCNPMDDFTLWNCFGCDFGVFSLSYWSFDPTFDVLIESFKFWSSLSNFDRVFQILTFKFWSSLSSFDRVLSVLVVLIFIEILWWNWLLFICNQLLKKLFLLIFSKHLIFSTRKLKHTSKRTIVNLI